MGFYAVLAKYYNDIFPIAEGKVKFIYDRLPKEKHASLLDVGCANGAFGFALKDRIDYHGAACDITSIDLDKSMIEIADRYKDEGGYEGLVFETMDMMNLDEHFEPETFDLVTCFGNTLVHLHKDQVGEFMKAVRKLLLPEGVFVFQILNYDFIYDADVKELPLIENDRIRFERFYDLGSRKELTFSVKLTDKENGEVYKDRLVLHPLFKEDVEKLLEEAGFASFNIYSVYDGSYSADKLPLIVEARK